MRTCFVIALLAITAVTYATASEETEGSSEAHAEHLNEIGVFLGVTAGGEDDGHGKESATGTIGVDYRRRLSELVGLGILVEYSGGERRDHVGIVPVTFFLGSHAQLIAGAGWERPRDDHHIEFLARVGFGWAIDLVPGNGIRPEINVDFVDGEALVVIGASIGWEF